MQALCHIHLLGALTVTINGRNITHFRDRKTAGLLARLAFCLPHPITREEMMEMLWPDRDPSATRASLSTALSALRRQLEPPGIPPASILLAERITLQLHPEHCTTDVSAFHTALEAVRQAPLPPDQLIPRLQAATNLYTGELLPGYYEDWVLTERTHLQATYLDLIQGLMDHHETQGDLPQALEYASQIVTLTPDEEANVVHFMHLASALGQFELALHRYRQLQRLLQKQYGEEPSLKAQRIAREIAALRRKAIPVVYPQSGTVLESREAVAEQPEAPPAKPVVIAPKQEATLALRRNRFFGREAERAELRALLDERGMRLITLTGAGGQGKTRLMQELLRDLKEAGNNACYFIPLAEIRDPQRLPEVVRDALSLPSGLASDTLEPLVTFLNERPMLLILDNFEQLSHHNGPAFVAHLLEVVPSLKCVVTSRQRLGLEGEREVVLAPLPVPPPIGASPVDLLAYASVQMFVDRAQAVLPHFQITPHNATTLAALCHRLEGIPLAIELAAARAQVFSLGQMLRQLENRFELLASRPRDVREERHRTLYQAIAWSYDLLSPPLRDFFARLSVFHGSWTAEEAEAIAVTDSQGFNALEMLAHLQTCSLIRAEEAGGEMRFRMLETLREFATRQVSSEAWKALSDRHAEWFRQYAQRAAARLVQPTVHEEVRHLTLEFANLAAAWEWFRAQDKGEAMLQMGLSLSVFLVSTWKLSQGIFWLQTALAHPANQASTLERAHAFKGLGQLLNQHADFDQALRCYEEGFALYQHLEDKTGMAALLYEMGCWARHRHPQAKAYLEQSLALCREIGDHHATTTVLLALADFVTSLEERLTLLQEALEIRITVTGEKSSLWFINDIADCLLTMGDVAQGRLWHEKRLAISQQAGDDFSIFSAMLDLGRLALYEGDFAGAAAHFQACLDHNAQRMQREDLQALVLTSRGELAQSQGDFAQARSLFRDVLRSDEGIGKGGAEVALALLALEEEDPQAALPLLLQGVTYLSERRYLTLRHACLLGFAGVLTHQKQWTIATQLLGARAAWSVPLGLILLPMHQALQERLLARLRAALTPEAFDSAWETGQGLTPEQAIEDALTATTP